MHIKLAAILIFLGLGMAIFPARGEDDVPLVLPLRVVDKNLEVTECDPDGLKLVINGSSREIDKVVRREERLNVQSNLGRNLVLSFQIDEYGRDLSECIASFIHQLVDSRDTLTVLSPLKSYQMRISGNKEKIVQEIGRLLTADCHSFRSEKNAEEKRLKTMMDQFGKIMSDISRSSDFNVLRFKEISRFLDVFPPEFEKFRNRFLILEVERYNQIPRQFRTREGEKWWIHFHQRETSEIISDTKGIIRQINEYFREYVADFNRIISHLDDLLDFPKTFPAEQLLESMIDSNMCYNVVFFGSRRSNDTESLSQSPTGLISIMGDVCKKSGGRSIVAVDLEEGLKEIEKHPNLYYELIFTHNGRIESQNIIIRANDKKNTLIYKKNFKSEEIAELVHYFKNEKISIENYLILGKTLKFSVRKFKQEGNDKIGLVKVGVILLNKSGETVFQSMRTLRASKEMVSLTLPLPEALNGNFQLRVIAIDLIANRLTSWESGINL